MADNGTMLLNWTATPTRIGVVKASEANVKILPPGQSKRCPNFIGADAPNSQREDEKFAEKAFQYAIHLHSMQQDADLAIVEHPDFNVVRDGNGRPMIEAQISNKRKRFKLEKIVELVLQNAKRRAENALGGNAEERSALRSGKRRTVNAFENLVEKALIVVDGDIANYAFVERIGKDNGLKHIAFFNRSKMIGCGFSSEGGQKQNNNILVFALFRHSFEITVQYVSKFMCACAKCASLESSRRLNDNDKFEVKYSTVGNSLSAEAFEQCLIKYMIEELTKQNAEIDFNSKEVKLELQKQSNCIMKQFVDDVSREYKSSVRIKLPGVRGQFTIAMDRVEFEAKLCFDLYTTFLDELEKAFQSAGLIYSQIDAVFALGESQNNHKIREFFLQNFSGKVRFEQTNAEEKLFRQLIDQHCAIDKFQIFVKTLCGKTRLLNVHAEDTIGHVTRKKSDRTKRRHSRE